MLFVDSFYKFVSNIDLCFGVIIGFFDVTIFPTIEIEEHFLSSWIMRWRLFDAVDLFLDKLNDFK